ncbi:MAG TPA: SDR family oxidoreductase [Dehalococcoidia bacterium]|nr:SDR family oxidoreductase [Dehalococcoidia bacterium]
MGLEGRVAVVSGGGRGIGAGISLALARDGADVAMLYARDAESAQDTARRIGELGRRAEPIQADIRDEAQAASAIEAAMRALGRIDILVNNAGIASRGLAVADTDPAEMANVVAVHAFGPFYLTRAALPHLREAAKERGRADVLFISSGATQFFGPNGAPYNMGKAAMEALAFTLAKEERRNNIRVNIVAPGLVETEMGRRLVRATRGVDDMRQLDAHSPFGRVCQPEDIGNMVAFLCSDGASYVTNQRIYVHGGGF